MSDDRLSSQITFLTEVDRLKSVLRANVLCDNSRRENSAEHSWHLTLYALLLAEQSETPVDMLRVLKMLIIHDLVEIDVGDVPIHAIGGPGHDSPETRAAEEAAARRIFGLLPPDQGADLLALWLEFEANESPDAVFAKSVDRTQPLVQNLASDGANWRSYGVTMPRLEARVGVKIARGLPRVWRHLRARAAAWFAAQAHLPVKPPARPPDT